MSRTPTPTQDYQAVAQERLAEPVLGVGFMSTAGRVADAVSSAISGKLLYQVSPFAALRRGKQAAARRDATFENRLVAVTGQGVHLFPFSLSGMDVTISGEALVWPRGTFRLTVEPPGRMTQTLHVELDDGTRFDGEVYRGKAYDDLTVPLLDLLRAASGGHTG